MQRLSWRWTVLSLTALALARAGAQDAPKPSGNTPPAFDRTAAVMALHEGRRSRGGLDLSTRDRLLGGGDSGAAVVPGESGKSLLLRLVKHQQEPAMPKQGKKLDDAETALLSAWIDAGAPYLRRLGTNEEAAWWSLQPIKNPIPPAADLQRAAWTRNPIDAFVLEKLTAAGLQPSPPAEPRVLIRRLHFDLHGLPPTPEEVDDFIREYASAEPQAAAVERLVDRLLASPRYGERWARHWMDVIHFAETHGHDQDVPREHAWPYRDYLIAALNQDKPYARFIEEQIAGDVLFPDDPRATVALGFLAAGPWDESSLKDIREDSIDRKAGQYLDRDDMLGTVCLALLSTTIQCARCHEHKFDPISQKEYFNLQAVFAGVDRANRAFDADPQLRARRLALLKLQADLAAGPAAAAKLAADPIHIATAAAWEEEQAKRKAAWSLLDPVAYKSAAGQEVTKLDDGSLRLGGKKPERDTYTIEAVSGLKTVRAVRLDVLTDDSLPQKGPGRQDNGNLHLNEVKIEAIAGAAVPGAEGGTLASSAANARTLAFARAEADFNQSGWEISKAIDGVAQTAWGIFPAVGQPHAAVFFLKEPVTLGPGERLRITLEQQHGEGHLIGRPRLWATDEASPSSLTPLPPSIQTALGKPHAQRTPAEQAALVLFAVKQRADRELAELPKAQLVYAAAADFQPDGSFRPARGVRPVHVLRRGDVKQPLELAAPAALACIPGLDATLRLTDPSNEGQRRAALAKWISDPRNVLAWRSIVNRVWHYHFGRGIVATPSDFGRMGAAPSHPELLDWLTTAFLEDGGSLKKLHRRILTSATYQQASAHRDAAAKLDADNALLWRMNVQRLDAESVRDAVLHVAGKIDYTMGGPSVKHFRESPGVHRTPQVDYTAFDPDAPGSRRRSVYRFIFRTVPDPFMDALDCPDASQFTAKRTVSVTALQALALLNDPFMVRMSEHFAKRVAGAGAAGQQVRQAYRLALQRDPDAAELKLLVDHAARHGLANACRVLLNCNEFAFVP